MKTVITIPDDCRNCSCFIVAKGTCGFTENSFYLCRAFDRVLTIDVNYLGKIANIKRCEECKKAEVEDVP